MKKLTVFVALLPLLGLLPIFHTTTNNGGSDILEFDTSGNQITEVGNSSPSSTPGVPLTNNDQDDEKDPDNNNNNNNDPGTEGQVEGPDNNNNDMNISDSSSSQGDTVAMISATFLLKNVDPTTSEPTDPKVDGNGKFSDNPIGEKQFSVELSDFNVAGVKNSCLKGINEQLDDNKIKEKELTFLWERELNNKFSYEPFEKKHINGATNNELSLSILVPADRKEAIESWINNNQDESSEDDNGNFDQNNDEPSDRTQISGDQNNLPVDENENNVNLGNDNNDDEEASEQPYFTTGKIASFCLGGVCICVTIGGVVYYFFFKKEKGDDSLLDLENDEDLYEELTK